VTPAARHDVPAIAALLEEMDRFYGETQFEPADQRASQIEELLFSALPAAFILLAKEEEEVVGLAAYTFLWPAVGITRSLYLKELYVRHSHQRRGVGTLLMNRLATIAAEHKCSRMEWTTDRDNDTAQKFYDRLPAPTYDGKVFYRLDADAIARVTQ
jgi:GNAT superfamily N-acetyltransferase